MTDSRPDQRKVVLITGATRASSLGAALALEFLDLGWRVFATSQSPVHQASWLEQKGGEILELELCDDKMIENVAREVQNRTGGVLDVLINNVSTIPYSRLTGLLGVSPFPRTAPDHSDLLRSRRLPDQYRRDDSTHSAPCPASR